jgi:outer membrane protein
MYKSKLYLMIIIMLTSHVEAADIMDVYNRSLNFNNDLQIITNDQKISREIYNQTSSNIFPEVSITANTQEINVNKYTGTGTQKDYSTESASLTITQPLLRLYFFDELNKAESIVKKSEINLEEFKKDLIVKSAELYFNLINAKNSVAAGEVKLDSMLIKYESAEKLFDNGYISDIELNKYKNNYEMTMVEKQILVNEFDMAKQDVYIFTGREIMDIHNLNHTIEIPLSKYDANSLISKALVSFNSIKSALLDVDISRDEMKSNKSKHYPTIDLNATYDYSDTSSGSRLGKQTRESNTIGLTINIPIYQGGFQKSKVTEARYKYKNAKINLDHLRRTIRKEILDNINNYNLLKSLVIVKRDRYNDVNQDYLTISQGADVGLYTDVEIKDAEYNLMVAKNDLIESTLDLLLVDLNLKKYSSNLSVENILTINRMLVW